MTEQQMSHWWIGRLQSPCCSAPLAQGTTDTLRCGRCARAYAMAPFGPDLMPPWLETEDAAVTQWRDVQAALGRWRQRTWTGGATAAAKADDTRRLVDAFLRAVQPGGEVLDIGCGNGWIRELLEPFGCTYAGVDPMRPIVASTADALQVFIQVASVAKEVFGCLDEFRHCRSRSRRWPRRGASRRPARRPAPLGRSPTYRCLFGNRGL